MSPNSLAQPADLNCPRCKRPFTGEIWLILDAAERPDLLERAAQGRLHVITCPHCGFEGMLGASVLVYRPGSEPVLAYSPAHQIDEAQEQEQMYGLVSLLRQSLGADWRHEWLDEMLQVPPRALPTFLRQGASAAQQELDQGSGEQQAIAARRRLDSVPPDQRAQAILDALLAGQVLALQPEDLDDRLFELLDARLQAAPHGSQERRDLESIIQQLSPSRQRNEPERLLSQAGELGEQMRKVLGARSPGALAQVLDQNPLLLSDEALALLEALSRTEALKESRQVLSEKLEMMRRTREAGLLEALEETAAAVLGDEERIPAELELAFQDLVARQKEAIHFADRWPGIIRDWQVLIAKLQELPDSSFLTSAYGNLAHACANYFEVSGDETWASMAEELYQQVGEQYSRQEFPGEWANTRHSLGTLYDHRYAHSLDEGFAAQAEQYYLQALEVRTFEDDPLNWAQTMHSLAILYLRMFEQGGRPDFADLAQEHFEGVLKVRTKENNPILWANTQMNLGSLYAKRYENSNDLAQLDAAQAHFQAALRAYDRTRTPARWASAQVNLANVFGRRYADSHLDDDFEDARACLQNALAVYTRDESPTTWAAIQQSLGGLHFTRFRTTGEESAAEAAQERFTGIVELAESSLISAQFPLDACESLVRLASVRRDWAAVTHWYSQHNRYFEQLYRMQTLRTSKEDLLKGIQEFYGLAVYAALQLGDLPAAVRAVESGRTRLLTESLGRAGADLQALHEAHPRLAESYHLLRGELDALQSVENRRRPDGGLPGGAPVEGLAELAEIGRGLNRQLESLLEEIRQQEGFHDFLAPVGDMPLPVGSAEQPLVYLLVTPWEGLALIVGGGEITPLWLPGLTQPGLRRCIYGQEVVERGLTGMIQVEAGYLGAYSNWINTLSSLDATPQRAAEATRVWKSELESATAWCWQAFMGTLVEALQASGASQAVLVPTGFLSYLPLHAAWTEDATQPGGRRYALDSVNFTYAPSARLMEAARKGAGRQARSLLAVVDPTGTLSYAPLEAADISLYDWEQVNMLYDSSATLDAVKDSMRQAGVLHFSTHGIAGFIDPLESYLQLAGGERLTLAEVLDLRLEQSRLAVLSACETGIPGTLLADESISLPSGFMQAGVPGVIGSLWSVEDASTMLVMRRFYELWRDEGMPPSEALRQAQIWLRGASPEELSGYRGALVENVQRSASGDVLPEGLSRALRLSGEAAALPETGSYDHPFYWAAFYYSGV